MSQFYLVVSRVKGCRNDFKISTTSKQTFWHLVNLVVTEPILGVLLSWPYRHVVLSRRKL